MDFLFELLGSTEDGSRGPAVNSSNCLLNSEFALNCQQKQKKHQQFEKKAGEETGVGSPSSAVCPTLHHCRPRPPQLTVPPSSDVSRSRGHVGLALLAAGVSPVRVETDLVSYLFIFSTDDTTYNQDSEAHSVVHRTPLWVPVMVLHAGTFRSCHPKNTSWTCPPF